MDPPLREALPYLSNKTAARWEILDVCRFRLTSLAHDKEKWILVRNQCRDQSGIHQRAI